MLKYPESLPLPAVPLHLKEQPIPKALVAGDPETLEEQFYLGVFLNGEARKDWMWISVNCEEGVGQRVVRDENDHYIVNSEGKLVTEEVRGEFRFVWRDEL